MAGEKYRMMEKTALSGPILLSSGRSSTGPGGPGGDPMSVVYLHGLGQTPGQLGVGAPRAGAGVRRPLSRSLRSDSGKGGLL